MKISKVLFLSAILALAVGCSEDDSNSDQNNKKADGPSKPLPDNCRDDESMPITVTWNQVADAFSYSVKFGYKGATPFEFESGDETYLSYSYADGRRGRSYEGTVELMRKNGLITFKTMTVSIPLCADREKHQRRNPKYNEPIELNVVF